MRFQRDSMARRREALRLDGLADDLAIAGPLLADTAAPRITPAAKIERIIRAKGTVSNDVPNIEMDRKDPPPG